jgi:hypothetical protein
MKMCVSTDACLRARSTRSTAHASSIEEKHYDHAYFSGYAPLWFSRRRRLCFSASCNGWNRRFGLGGDTLRAELGVAGSIPLAFARAPEGTGAEIEKEERERNGGQKLCMVWSGGVIATHAPGHLAKDQHKEQKESAGYFEKNDSADAGKWLEKACCAAPEAAWFAVGSTSGCP